MYNGLLTHEDRHTVVVGIEVGGSEVKVRLGPEELIKLLNELLMALKENVEIGKSNGGKKE